jgi:hypothetical protein
VIATYSNYKGETNMAFTELVPATINVNMRQGAAQHFRSSAVQNFAGTAIDLSAWNTLTAKAVAASPNPNTADVTFGTVTGDASGIITLAVSATDLASVPLGSTNLVILGKTASGDAYQMVASGTLQISAG